jgi:uncharacterized protein (DUF58 family)
VTPLVARLRNALLVSRRRPGVRGSGAPVKRRSDGYEFAELRSYVEGDDPRRIDWAATARAGGLQTRVVFEDHALTLGAALDASGSMFVGRTQTNYDRALECAALWYEAALDEDRCARAGADGLTFVRGLRGRSAARLCSELREPAGSSFGAALHVALAVLPRDAQLLLVSDFFELAALEPLLRACTARFSTLALLASDPWRDGLPLGGFVRLRDAESGRVRRWYVGKRERERYLTAVEERERAVLARLLECGANAALLAGDGPAPALFDALGIGGRRSAAS